MMCFGLIIKVGLQTADYNEDFDWDRPFESGVVAVTGGACILWALVMGAAFVVTFASIALEVRSRDLDLRGKWSIFVSWNSDVGFSDEFLLSIGVMTHDDPIHATRMRGILENITQQWLHRDMAVAFVSWRDNAERQKRARRLDINELTSEAKQTAATGSGSVDVRGPDVLAISSSALVFTSESLPLNNHGDPAGARRNTAQPCTGRNPVDIEV